MFDEEIVEGIYDWEETGYCDRCYVNLNEKIISEYHESTCNFCQIRYNPYPQICKRCVKELFQDHKDCDKPIDVI